MKPYIFLSVAVCALVLPFIPHSASALSCLPVDTYLKEVVGKDEIVIFTATQADRAEETDYTRERVMVTKAMQGYMEKELFVYHQKHPDWGYLCNAGPSAKKGSLSVYIAERDTFGKYSVYQRLEADSDQVKTLEADLKKANTTGEVSELSATDHANQIMTTIEEMIGHIMRLLKEYAYFKTAK